MKNIKNKFIIERIEVPKVLCTSLTEGEREECYSYLNTISVSPL